jgi:rRNA maturation RNase YbeY
MKIEVSEQDEYPDLGEIPVDEIARFTCTELGLLHGSCHIIFREDTFLQNLHKQYFNDPSPTDVITFDLGEETVEGEIYIAEGQARQQCKQYRVPLSEEVARLVIHGILHLKGYEDEKTEDRAIMKDMEDQLVRKVKKQFLE